MRARLCLAVTVATSALLATPVRLAAAHEEDLDDYVEDPRFVVAPIARYTVRSTTSAPDAGAARTIVHAPLAKVRAVGTDYEKGQFIHGIDRTKIVARRGSVSDLYIRAPVLNGAVHLWAILRLAHTVHADHEMIRGDMIRGNLESMTVVGRLVPLSPDSTLIEFEVMADPGLPLPSSFITEELQYAAEVLVSEVRYRSEH